MRTCTLPKTATITITGASLAALLMAGLLGTPVPAGAEELTALEIATRSDDATSSDTEHQIMTMTLENRRGQQRVRTIEGWSREISDEEEHRFSRFLEPADVRDTTLLSYDYDHKDDDTWLYLPALKKIKRILSSNKDDYFMGSDFTYEDMENLDLVNRDYTLKGSETIMGADCYIVESVPNNEEEADESGYLKTVLWVDKTNFLTRQVDFTDKKSRHSKRMSTDDIRTVGGEKPRPRAHKISMENFITKHKTVIQFSEFEVDIPVDEDVFSQRNLRQ